MPWSSQIFGDGDAQKMISGMTTFLTHDAGRLSTTPRQSETAGVRPCMDQHRIIGSAPVINTRRSDAQKLIQKFIEWRISTGVRSFTKGSSRLAEKGSVGGARR